MPKGSPGKKHLTWVRHGIVGACERNHETVKKMAEAGAALDLIGRTIGTNKRHVRKYLTKHNIKRPVWRNPPNSHPMSRPVKGELNPAWNGGRILDKRKNRKTTYVMLYMPGHPEANRHNKVYEHRIVMAKKLGRPLKQREVVHHIDGNGENNHPDNLELFANNGEHLRATMTGVPCPARGRKLKSNPKPTKTSDRV